jgi:hypothetical protein
MTSAIVYAYFFLHVGAIVVSAAYFVIGSVLAPQVTRRARIRFARRPWLPVVLGLAVSGPWVATSLVLLAAPSAAAKFAGAVAGCLWVLLGLLGGAALAQHFGAPGSAGPVRWNETMRGGLLIGLTWILPLVGWLGMLPLTISAGVGCMVMGLIPDRPVPALEPVTA